MLTIIKPTRKKYSLERIVTYMKYDVVIIGAGPGGIFSAYELMEQNKDLKIAVFESGNPLEGDAGQILKELEGPFDMIFMDAAKGQYINWLPDVMRLMQKGGVLISDNVLQEGDIIESHYLVERRNRTIYKRMREYLYELKHNPSLITSIIPLGDGVTVSVKQE